MTSAAKRRRSTKKAAASAADPSSPVHFFSEDHLFVELHEFQNGQRVETHWWNHGLEEDHDDPLHWSRPHLPEVSLVGMVKMHDLLKPDVRSLPWPAVPTQYPSPHLTLSPVRPP